MALKEIVAKNIRFYRIKKNLTQEELASKCAMHDNYISKIELAKISVGIENFEKIAKALGVKPSQLMERVHKEK